jgi:dihydroxyacid dehydratase/phosphogluconate dehydratase
MKYRRLSADGDYVFGFGNTNFLVGADAVAQAIGTKLKMFQGDFWENLNEGIPFFQEIAGNGNPALIDLLIQTRIKETPGVSGIAFFVSSLTNRAYSATASVSTIYGATVEVTV